MTVKELNKINGESAFKEARMHQLKSILLLLTIGGFIIVMLWQMFDKYYLRQTDNTLLWLRIATASVYIANIILAFIRNSNHAYKQHITAGFYFGTIFCTILAMLTGASQSPYWFGLFFILIGWFVLVPFTYRELILHSLMFCIIFISGLFAQTEFKLINYEIAKIVFLYSGTLFIGFYAAISRNQGEAESYLLTKALKEKNKELNKFRKVLEQAPGSVLIMDTGMNFEYLNPMFRQLSGYTEEELLHKNINDTLYKGKTPESRAEVAKALMQGEKWQGELLTYHKTGQSYWANTIASPYKDEQGSVEGYIIIQQDISEHKKMEIALRESEELYRTLIESSLEGIALTQDGKILLTNQAFCDIYGYSADEMKNLVPDDLLSPDDRDRVSSYHYKRMEGEMDSLDYTATFLHKSGRKLLIEVKNTTVKVNGKNASFSTSRDITENRKMEIALRESETLYRTLIEKSLNGVSITRNKRFFLINDAFCNILGYPKDEIMEIQPESLLAPEDRERVLEIHDKRMRGELDTLNYTAKFVHKTGRHLILEMSSTTVQVDGQNASFVTMRDITEQHALREALEKSELKYKTLVENSQDGILIIRDDKILFANNTISRILDYPIDEFYQMPSINLLHPDDRYKTALIAQKRKNQDFSTINEEFRMIARNGEVKECETSSTLIEFDGQWASFFTIQDLTDSKRLQKELKENEEKYRQLFAAESDAIFMIDADTGEILDANPATTSIYGYSHAELLLMKNTDVSAEPEKTREATHNHVGLVPIRYHKKKDGTVFPVELSAGFTTLGNRNIQIVTSRDITERIQSQEALSKSEQKYRELAEMLPQAIYELDAHGNPKYLNKAGFKIFGIENGTGDKKAFDFFVPEDMQRMKQALKMEAARLVSDEGELEPIPSDPMEFTAQRPDGSRFPVLIYGTSVIEDGKVTGSRGMIIDISERKAMENALRESESKYKTLIENSQDGIFAVIGNKVHFVNNTLCRMLGYTAGELYNMPALSMLVPEDRDRGMEISQSRVKGDWSTKSGIFHLLAKDGSIKECDIFSSVLELNGQTVSLITVHDLTETRWMQKELIKSEQKYRELADFLPQTIFELDNKGDIVYVNKTGMDIFGLSENDYGKTCIDLFVEDDREALIQNIGTILQGLHTELMYEYTARNRQGRIFPVLSYSLPVYKEGDVVGIRGMVLDISERKATEKILFESEQKYRTVIDKATDGIVITQQGKLKFVNNTMCEMLQFAEEELIELPFLDLVIDEDRQVMIDYHNRRMAGEDFTSLYRSHIKRKDGSVITVELNARTSTYNGSPAAFIIIRDISDRVKIENELQTAKNNLEMLNRDLEQRVIESSESLTEARTQLINLQKENLQSQFDVLKQQVNPHFLFNSLNVLTSLIKLEPDLAEKFSEHLSKVYRYVLENKDNELVDLNTELIFLDAYIFLLNIRFVNKLNVNINIPESKRSYQVIPLAMQLLIENAIKHNIMSKSNPLQIDIFIDKNNFLNIVNNLQERPSQIVSTGVGLKNIQNRYLLLNNTEPVFEKTNTHFIAKVPLIKID